MKKNIAILVFKNVEVLDFAGPFEVFSSASELHQNNLFNVFAIAQSLDPISTVGGLSVNPHYSISEHPEIDVLIISGGSGTKALLENRNLLQWIARIHQTTEFTVSICSGSRLLGKLRLLDNKPYATHHEVYEHMQSLVPTGIPMRDKRFIQAGKIFTSGGISAGIDLSFHILQKLIGHGPAKATAAYMEYNVQNENATPII